MKSNLGGNNMFKKRFSTVRILLCLMLVTVLAISGCSSETSGKNFTGGTYTAEGQGHNGPIEVEVKVSDTQIEEIKIISHTESIGISDSALDRIPTAIIDRQSLAIDAVSGATVTSNGIIAAVEAALVKAGADIEKLKIATEQPNEGKTEKLIADVVVIGAGGSGASAAVTAAEQGAQVILLEKNINPGGTTATGGGLFAAHSDIMRAKNQGPVDTDRLLKDWMKEMVWQVDANLIRQYLDLSYTTVDWLSGYGFEFYWSPGVQQTHADYHGYHKYIDFTKSTEAFRNFIQVGLVDRGGEVFYETPAKSLIQDENGAITGVIAQRTDGTILEISAKSVVIATGGFVGDSEWVASTVDGVSLNISGLASNVGDGIRMAWDAGGAKRGENVHLAHTFSPKPGTDLSDFGPASMFGSMSILYLPITTWVNYEGLRFADEDIIYDRAWATNAVIAQGNQAYMIFNQDMIDTLEAEGALAAGMEEAVAMGPMTEVGPMKSGWTNLNDMMQELVKQGSAFKGDSIEELAKASGMNEDTFLATMSKYNEDAVAGKDTLFGKRKGHMVPMIDGPFYAVIVTPNNLGTLGGIRINHNMQVVKADPNSYEPIPNLYAAGSDVGGLYSDHYVLLEGGAQGWAYNSGRLAGASAAGNALNKKIDLLSK